MKAHRTDGVSLGFGLVFLAIAGWWAAAQVIDIRLPALGWLAAGGLILFGVLGLLGAISSGRRDEAVAPTDSSSSVDSSSFVDSSGFVDSGGPTADRPDRRHDGPWTDAPVPDGDLSTEEHSDIVRELLEDPADRLAARPGDAPVEHIDPTAPGQRGV